jgi:hypothetical protein
MIRDPVKVAAKPIGMLGGPMLTILHPQIMPAVHRHPIGLLPLLFNTDEIRPKLVIKMPKEAILAAKLNRGFKIYVAPILLQHKRTVGLVTAFFDDIDEPFVISSPLFDEPGVHDLRKLLLLRAIDVHLFDENNRELLGYAADISCPAKTRGFLEGATFPPFDYDLAIYSIKQMNLWFGQRSPQDDFAAICVTFFEPLFAEDLFIQDMCPENHSYHGSKSSSFTVLERQEPGHFQECDIVKLLHRIFAPNQIYHGPLRTTDEEEIVDILVVTEAHALFIQAKDSPNTQAVLRNSLQRKKATARKNLTKAIRQVRGALRYAKSSSPMRILIGGKEATVMLAGLEIRALIVIKELFDDDYPSYSSDILSLANRTEVPCIALDYPELHMFTTHLTDAEAFFRACDNVFVKGAETGVFPRVTLRPRFSDLLYETP